jgi:hypothetical protein
MLESRWSFFKPPQLTAHLRIVSFAVLLKACRSPARDFNVDRSEDCPDGTGDLVGRASGGGLELCRGSGLRVLRFSSEGVGDGA